MPILNAPLLIYLFKSGTVEVLVGLQASRKKKIEQTKAMQVLASPRAARDQGLGG
jgi:hypothetical protein